MFVLLGSYEMPKQRQSKNPELGIKVNLTTSIFVYDMTVRKAKSTDLKKPETTDKEWHIMEISQFFNQPW